MARKTTSLERMDPVEAQIAISKHLRKFQSVNRVQYQAQLYEQKMVDFLASVAMDATNPNLSLRRACALDVIKLARGDIRPWIHDGKTIDPQATGVTGNKVGEEVRAAEATADLNIKVYNLVAMGIPPEQWPPEALEVTKELVSVYSETEG